MQDFNTNPLKIDRKSYKHINIYYIRYVTKKDSKYVNTQSVNPLHFVVDKLDSFTEEKDGNKYLNFASTDNNKEVLRKYTKLWYGIKNSIEKIDHKPGEYGKDYMKIKFNSYDNLLLNK